MSEQTQDFPKGLFAKKPNDNAPKFLKSKISVKRKEFIEYLESKTDEWLNFDVLESKDQTKHYLKQDTWKPTQAKTEVSQDINPEDIPF